MPSYEFTSFVESYFGDPYMAWHDGLDEQSLLGLKGEELAEAERMLLEGLKTGDDRPAAGLASLRSKKAAPALKELLPYASGDTLINTALALWQIEKYPPAVPALIGVLKSDATWGRRMNAATALAHVRTPESVAALFDALSDPDELVRCHAAESLLTMHGLEEDESPDRLSIAIMSGQSDKRRQVREQIKKLIADQGRLAEE